MMKMKELEFNDIYEVAEIIKTLKVDLSDEEMKQMEKGGMKVGFQIIFNMIGNIKRSKKQMNNLLGYLFGITGEEFGKLKIKEVGNCLKELSEFKKSEDGIYFFEQLGQLMS